MTKSSIFVLIIGLILILPGFCFAQDSLVTLTGISFIDSIINWVDSHRGSTALIIVLSERLANITPTQWDNKILGFIFGAFYKVFATFGVKLPEINSIDDLKDKK